MIVIVAFFVLLLLGIPISMVKINQSLRDVDNGAGSKGLFSVNVD